MEFILKFKFHRSDIPAQRVNFRHSIAIKLPLHFMFRWLILCFQQYEPLNNLLHFQFVYKLIMNLFKKYQVFAGVLARFGCHNIVIVKHDWHVYPYSFISMFLVWI